MHATAMCWGFDCGDGWYQIIDDLCKQMQDHCDGIPSAHTCRQVIAVQVKEKYGGLRFYVHGGCEFIDQMIHEAMKKSQETCEICGQPGTINHDKGWLSCRCPEHKDK